MRREGRAYLCLGVRAQPGHLAAPPQLGHLGVETVGQDDGERHALLRLVGGVAEHQALTETETEGGLFLLNSLDRRVKY